MKLKFMIIGHARHGKDTVAQIFTDYGGYTFKDSSLTCCEIAIYPELKKRHGYESIQECYEDRSNHRQEWHELIVAYNTPDLSKLSRYIFDHADIYVGIRNPDEFFAARHQGLFDLAIWVDASKRLPPEDKKSSQMEPWMADIIIDNNSEFRLTELRTKRLIDTWK